MLSAIKYCNPDSLDTICSYGIFGESLANIRTFREHLEHIPHLQKKIY